MNIYSLHDTLTFDDVLIKPKFSTVESRKDVDLSVKKLGLNLGLGLISANMDSVTGSDMAIALANNGAIGCLHRFWDIETNVKEFCKVKDSILNLNVICSVGLGFKELERAEALFNAGSITFVVDVANGASVGVVKQTQELRKLFKDNVSITVGNFATGKSVKEFLNHFNKIDGIKANIGAGSRCTTRVVTGCGYPQLSSIMEISDVLGYPNNLHITLIADGGMDSIGSAAKALGAGAHLLMSGSFFSGCEETPGEKSFDVWDSWEGKDKLIPESEYSRDTKRYDLKRAYKIYRGSASKESYEVQGKTASWRAPEGESTYIPYKGPVKNVLEEISGGLRSAFSYTNSRNLEEFHRNCEFVRVSSNTVVENGTRGGTK